jgi:hypothetical protein
MQLALDEIGQKRIMAVLVRPRSWIKLKTGYFADPDMWMGSDGKPLAHLNAHEFYLAAQGIGLTLLDNKGYHELVSTNPKAAEDGRNHGTLTGILRDIYVDDSGYGAKCVRAKFIARPEVRIAGGKPVFRGSEKPVRLPMPGWFYVDEVDRKTGLPIITYGEKKPHGESACFWVLPGAERPLVRGFWPMGEHAQFNVDAEWEMFDALPYLGARLASETEPSPAVMAAAEVVGAVEHIRRKYGLGPDEVAVETARYLI